MTPIVDRRPIPLCKAKPVAIAIIAQILKWYHNDGHNEGMPILFQISQYSKPRLRLAWVVFDFLSIL